MRKRDILRYVPGFSNHIQRLEQLESEVVKLRKAPGKGKSPDRNLINYNTRLESENQPLRKLMHELLFAGDPALLTEASPTPHDPFPLPVAALRYLVAGSAHVEVFLRTGKQCADTVVAMLQRQSLPLAGVKRVLDFGCGCGRVLRHLKGQFTGDVYGTDPNAKAVRWCENHLGGKFSVNESEPPLTFGDEMFDLAYAFSIFTHLTEDSQKAWMRELRRVLVPGGLFLLTVHGAVAAKRNLPGEHQRRFQQGEMVIIDKDLSGSNFCATYHPDSYVREVLAQGFDVVDHLAEKYNAVPPQDAYLLRRRN